MTRRVLVLGLGAILAGVTALCSLKVAWADDAKAPDYTKILPADLVKDTPKVTGFIGNQRPQEVTPPQIDDLRKSIVEGAVKPKPRVSFEAGDEIRVIDGAFANFSGTVEEVKPDKQKLRVKVSIFGRATPVELDFSQVEKRV